MLTDIINDINQAISTHKVLKIYYKDNPDYRIIEPHTLGINQIGNTLLSAYQVDGYSESGEPIAWKLFKIDDICSINITENTFKIRWTEGYNPEPSTRMFKTIINKV